MDWVFENLRVVGENLFQVMGVPGLRPLPREIFREFLVYHSAFSDALPDSH